MVLGETEGNIFRKKLYISCLNEFSIPGNFTVPQNVQNCYGGLLKSDLNNVWIIFWRLDVISRL